MRLKESYNTIIKNDMDYAVYPYIYFYFINTEQIAFRGYFNSFKKNKPCKGVQQTYKMIYAKNLPFSEKRKSIDG
jgi:hypothetical protein